MSKPLKPEPVNKNVVCSVCGLAWEKHGEPPTLEDCVRLLRVELLFRDSGADITTCCGALA